MVGGDRRPARSAPPRSRGPALLLIVAALPIAACGTTPPVAPETGEADAGAGETAEAIAEADGDGNDRDDGTGEAPGADADADGAEANETGPEVPEAIEADVDGADGDEAGIDEADAVEADAVDSEDAATDDGTGDGCDDDRLLAADDLVVFAPHPDDESLGFGGVIHDAVELGKRVKVVVVTGGDYNLSACWFWRSGCPEGAAGCAGSACTPAELEEFAQVRLAESRAAMALLGLPPEDLLLLGYPDGRVRELYFDPTAVVPANTTRTLSLTGKPFTGESLRQDLEDVLAAHPGAAVFTTHERDTHRDHAYLARFARLAGMAVFAETGAVHPTWWSVIHSPDGDGTWPPPPCTWTPARGTAAADRERRYAPTEALLPPPSMAGGPLVFCIDDVLWDPALADPPLLRQAVDAYASQIGLARRGGGAPDAGYEAYLDGSGYLISFVRRTHLFWEVPTLADLCARPLYVVRGDNSCDAWVADTIVASCPGASPVTCCDDGSCGGPCNGCAAGCTGCPSAGCPDVPLCASCTSPCVSFDAAAGESTPAVPPGSTVVLAGGPAANRVVARYERRRLAPVCFRYYSSAGTDMQCFESPCGSGRCVPGTAVPAGSTGLTDDFLVIELFRDDALDVDVLIAYGTSGMGTLAVGYLFGNEIGPSLASFPGRWYVYRWIDRNGNGSPDEADEYRAVAAE
jgi:LmbE family N-acetylglucosaminyl deacetylase